MKKNYDKDKAQLRYQKIRDNNIDKILKYLKVEELSCNHCGISNSYFGFFDFHHVIPETKIHSISYMMGHKDWDKMKTELDKCEVLCPNCHRQHHLKEQENGRKKEHEREIFKINILRQGN